MNSLDTRLAGSEYNPTATERRAADEAYIRYLANVAVVHDPFAIEEMHGLDPEADSEQILADACGFMLANLREIISYANPSPHKAVKFYENNFEQAEPHMNASVERVHTRHLTRIRAWSESIASVRPAAMTRQQTYRYICKGRNTKIELRDLMDGVWPHPIFSYYRNRKLPAIFQAATEETETV